MCTYNSIPYLDEQLASILGQSRLPDELVICDDGSSDDTVEKLRTYAQIAPFPVRIVINERNLGYTKNFEKAISFCNGDMIVLSDHDDIWMGSRLEKTENVFVHHPRVGLVFSDAAIIDHHSSPTGARLWSASKFGWLQKLQFKHGRATQALLNHNVVTGATMAFRSEFREMILPIPEIWIHDGWIALVVSFFAKLAALDEPLIRYRRHANQQVGLPSGFLEKIASGGKAQRSVLELQVGQFEAVYDRLAAYVDTEQKDVSIRSIRRKISHMATRARRPGSRILRVPVVLRELGAMRYTLYSSGLKSAVWDLLV